MKTGPPHDAPDPTCDAPCKYVGKALKVNPRVRKVDVDALLECLESRNAARRGPESAAELVPLPIGAADGVSLADVLPFRSREESAGKK